MPGSLSSGWPEDEAYEAAVFNSSRDLEPGFVGYQILEKVFSHELDVATGARLLRHEIKKLATYSYRGEEQ